MEYQLALVDEQASSHRLWTTAKSAVYDVAKLVKVNNRVSLLIATT